MAHYVILRLISTWSITESVYNRPRQQQHAWHVTGPIITAGIGRARNSKSSSRANSPTTTAVATIPVAAPLGVVVAVKIDEDYFHCYCLRLASRAAEQSVMSTMRQCVCLSSQEQMSRATSSSREYLSCSKCCRPSGRTTRESLLHSRVTSPTLATETNSSNVATDATAIKCLSAASGQFPSYDFLSSCPL